MSEWFYTSNWLSLMVGWLIGWVLTIIFAPHLRTRFNVWFNVVCLGLVTIVYLVVVWVQQ